MTERATERLAQALVSGLALGLLTIAWPAPAEAQGDHVGQYARADVEHGLRLYRATCVTCHGEGGDGVVGIDLAAGTPRAATDTQLSFLIRAGIPGTAMPAGEYSEAELTALVAYVRMMGELDSANVRLGDPGQGESIVMGKGECTTCHRLGDAGQLGAAPPLTAIGAARTAGVLEASLLDPTGSMFPINRPVRVVLGDGSVVEGRRLNEDTYSVQLIDSEGRLRSLDKSTLREFTVIEESPMPSYADSLTEEEISDVVAYLLTLQGVEGLDWMTRYRHALIGAIAAGTLTLAGPVAGQGLTFERLLNAEAEPHNWLTYSGSYDSQRHTALDQIGPDNVGDLELKWVFQAQSLQVFQTSPLVVDGIMYLTEAPNTVVALDAKLGRVFWRYVYTPSTESRPCCGRVNRGLGMLGNTLYMATIDARLIAIDATTGEPLWFKEIAEPTSGFAMTLAPLIIKDKVIIGVAGGEYGVRGFIAAYEADTGEEAWRFYTIPAPGEPGHETWEGGGDAWMHGGASVWLTGSYDPETNLTFWGIGNPGPDWNPEQRPGDNLYSDSVVALDADTGELDWYFQFTPNDDYDYDSVQIPVLVDYPAQDGSTLKLMLWGNRNGFFYVLDRENGQFISGDPYVFVNWAESLDDNGRPVETPQAEGEPTFPGVQGGTNWYSPSYSPSTRLFYLSAWEGYGSIFEAEESEYREGQLFLGGRPGNSMRTAPGIPGIRRGAINNWTEAAGTGAVVAIDPATGDERWRFDMTDVTSSGILTTGSDLLFTGNREGYFHALDAETGDLLWRRTLGGMIANGPMSFAVDGQQFVAAAAGNSLFVFGLPE